MLKCLLQCKNNEIIIAGFVSDNAPALKTALKGNRSLNLHALLGQSVFRLACIVHSAQLADLLKQGPGFKSFSETFLDLLSWIKAREQNFRI